MSTPPRHDQPQDVARRPVTLTKLGEMRALGEPIVMVTAYDHPSAKAAEAAGVDIVLVGDSAANNVLGYTDTVPVTVDELLMLAAAVRRGLRTPLLVGDLPFGSYEASDEQAIATAHRFVKEAGCDAVKLEGSAERARAIVRAGVPVMGHVGLTPQTATALGGYRAQGRTAERARAVLDEALALQEAGCFSIVFEAIPADVTDVIMGHMEIPVIGIGAGAQHGRPGARAARPARHPRRLPAEVRQALRRRARRDGARAGGLRRGRAHARASRARSTRTGSRRRSCTGCRSSCPRGSAPEPPRRLGGGRTCRSQLHSRPMVQLSKLFAPKEREFFDLFEEAGANIVRAAGLLERMVEEWPDHGELARDIVVCEQEGDRITHDIIQRLNQTFVTPIDREDIYALASGLDDIVDWIEEVADFFALYRIEAPMSQAQQQARILHQSLPAGRRRRSRGCAASRTSTTSRSRSTATRTRATGSSARRSPRCSRPGSTRCW